MFRAWDRFDFRQMSERLYFSNLSTIVIEGTAPGGQAGTSSKIENYLGFPTGVSGAQLASRGHLQALKFGVHFAISRDIVSAQQVDEIHKLTLAGERLSVRDPLSWQVERNTGGCR